MYKFVRSTKLHNISGRAGYISNPKAQEEIVLQSEPVDWKPYAEYEIANQRSKEKNNQGRELVIALPNSYANLYFLKDKIEKLVELTVGKTTDVQWAVHWNEGRSNLHVHIIFSERTRVPEHERKVYDRDIYLTSEGKVARRKADRARDENGNIKPPVHRKGELQGEFSAKDTKYKSKGWLEDTKILVMQQYEKWGITIDEQGLLHQHHVPKGAPESLVQKNEAIKQINRNYKTLLANPNTKQKDIDKFKQEALKAAKSPTITMTKVLSGVPQRNIFERAVEGISSASAARSAKKAEEAARKVAEEQARKAAAEARAAAEQAAREVARARYQQEASAFKEKIRDRINLLDVLPPWNWQTPEILEALKEFKDGKDIFPVIYFKNAGGWQVQVFQSYQLDKARNFFDETQDKVDFWVERYDRKEKPVATKTADYWNERSREKEKEKQLQREKENKPEREIKKSSGRDARE